MKQRTRIAKKFLDRCNRSEHGESGLGLLVAALVIGGLIAAVTITQNFFFEGKEAKIERRLEAQREQNKKALPVHRAPSGYQVKY